MSAPITMHGEWEDNYDDPTHPIPSLTSLDIQVVKKTGGADLVIVVSSPLRADEKSQNRLLDKIGNYLGFMSTRTFQESCGVATPDNTSIVIQLHPDSDAEIYELISRCRPWVAENNASIRVETLDIHEH